jgi:hypothetical protein
VRVSGDAIGQYASLMSRADWLWRVLAILAICLATAANLRSGDYWLALATSIALVVLIVFTVRSVMRGDQPQVSE